MKCYFVPLPLSLLWCKRILCQQLYRSGLLPYLHLLLFLPFLPLCLMSSPAWFVSALQGGYDVSIRLFPATSAFFNRINRSQLLIGGGRLLKITVLSGAALMVEVLAFCQLVPVCLLSRLPCTKNSGRWRSRAATAFQIGHCLPE
jgi:hypothetical protein